MVEQPRYDSQLDETLDATGDPNLDVRPLDGSAEVSALDETAIAKLTDQLKVTRAQFDEAVSAVGYDFFAVETYLRGQGGGE